MLQKQPQFLCVWGVCVQQTMGLPETIPLQFNVTLYTFKIPSLREIQKPDYLIGTYSQFVMLLSVSTDYITVSQDIGSTT